MKLAEGCLLPFLVALHSPALDFLWLEEESKGLKAGETREEEKTFQN